MFFLARAFPVQSRLHLEHMHVAGGLLVPDAADLGADRAAHGLGDRIGVAPAGAPRSAMCNGSPCTGSRICGRTQPIISFSSSTRGWPETCTRWVRSVMTSTPCDTSPLITRMTAFSLPGMAREEKITRSPREN